MDLKLIGYFPKATAIPLGWTGPENVIEICSVSDCVNSSPINWIEHWLHNELGFFNTISDAESVILGDAPQFKIFAFRLLPLTFIEGSSKNLKILDFCGEQLPRNFVSLGFDVANRTLTPFFECSPLSCNLLANEIPVNQFCLIDSLQFAIDNAVSFSLSQPEPGPYFVLEVLRAKT